MIDKPMPNSDETEKSVLACLLWEPGKCIDHVSALQPVDFYNPRYREIFDKSMEVLNAGKILDIPTLDEIMGNGEELRQIRLSVPTIINIESYVSTVKNYSNARKMISMCQNFISDAYEANSDDIPALVDSVEREVFDVGCATKEKGFNHIRSVMGEITDSIIGIVQKDPKYCGTPTTFNEIDKWIVGLRDQEVIVLAARPSLGKTSLALNMQRRIAANGIPVGIVSLEMGAVKLGQRQVFEAAQINAREVHKMTELQMTELRLTYDRLAAMPIYSYDSSPQWPTVRRRIRQVVREHGVKIVFIDYLQLLRLGKRTDSRQLEVATLSSELKELAMELDIPIVVLAQLNRDAEARAPRISDLRESGAIEQDADVVILLDRKRESEDKETAEAAKSGSGIPVQAIIAKNRNGATGAGDLLFFQQFTRFEDRSRMDDSDTY